MRRRVVDRQLRLARETLREALAVDERHDEVHHPLALVDRVDRHDVRMRQLRRRLRLAQEALAHVGVERELRRQQLDRDASVQAHVRRAVDDGHPASADLRVYQVLCADRGDQPVEQVVGHPRSEARRAPELRPPPTRPISSATYTASSTFSARLSACTASEVMCWCICGLALSRIRS